MVARTKSQQHSFDKGILDDDLLGRRDTRFYPGGLRKATNMIGVIGGPIASRGGTAFVDERPEMQDGSRLAPFQFSTQQRYLIVFTKNKAWVYLEDALQTATGVDTSFNEMHLAEMDYDQSLDTMLIVHEKVPAKKLQRTGSHADWSETNINWRNMPTHRFGNPTVGSATPTAKTGTITITGSANDFEIARVGDVVVLNGGRARITSVTSDTAVTATVHEDLDETKPADPGEWSLEQPVFSAEYGYPRSIMLDDNRLFIGGSAYLPTRVWGTASGGADLFDFMRSKDRLEDEFVQYDMEGSGVNAIHHMVAMDDQFTLTQGGLFVNIMSDEAPVSPENYRPRRHVPQPMSAIKPVSSDDAVFCIVADGDGNPVGCSELSYELKRDGYSPKDLNVLTASVLRKPVDCAARFSDGIRAAHHRFVVNSDGTVAVHHSLRQQEVSGWTLWETPGNSGHDKVHRVAVVGNDPYFHVERRINGQTRHYIERHDPSRKFDCSVKHEFATPSSKVTGLNHLNGELCKVWADGALMDDVVPVDGVITVTDQGTERAVSNIEVGLQFDWTLEPLPVEAQIAEGTLVGETHRLIALVLEVKDAFPFEILGPGMSIPRTLAFRKFGQFKLGDAVPTFTGRTPKLRFLGWDRGQGQTYTLSGFLPATILSATVEVGQ